MTIRDDILEPWPVPHVVPAVRNEFGLKHCAVHFLGEPDEISHWPNGLVRHIWHNYMGQRIERTFSQGRYINSCWRSGSIVVGPLRKAWNASEFRKKYNPPIMVDPDA